LSLFLEELLAATVSHALISIVVQAFHKTPEIENQIEFMTRKLAADQSLIGILRKANVSVAKSQSLDEPKQTEKLRMFFVSPEAETLTRQMYGLLFVAKTREKSEASMRSEFCTVLALHLGESPENLVKVANDLFDVLVLACERALAAAIDQGILSAHEAKSASRHRVLLDELSAIQENIQFLRSQPKPDAQEINDFDIQYRKQLVHRHGFITPPHFDYARKVPIKDICVSPRLVRRVKGDKPKTIRFEYFVASLYRAVVLGNPGGGKSTLAGKLCHDLAEPTARLLGGREITPILVVLRDFGAAKKETGCSIVQFIERTSNSSYQIAPPPRAFEYMLLNGRGMVIFDGLDELLESSTRQEITSDIESFCNLYPSTPVLVTSREVGYEQAPLNAERFIVYRLAPFDDDQVAEYVMKWFNADLELTPSQREQKTKQFLEESAGVPDLRSNPLMLALMCNIYRGENYIPRNRPDVYEKCSTMLFERWDKGRGILVPLPFEAHISPAMKFLAYWIYSDDRLQSGVTEDRLVSKAADYLARVRFEDRDEAESAARRFIEFCRGRAWVFTDTGSTKTGEALYQFTHRTFLEYFAAAFIVRSHPTPTQLLELLLPRIEKREWDVVAQLAFQLQNKQLEGAADELLTRLVQANNNPFVLSFAARCLQFMVPSPQVTRLITNTCIERTLSYCKPKRREKKIAGTERWSELGISELFGDCLAASSENLATVLDSFEKTLIKTLLSSSDSEALTAAALALLPGWARHPGAGRRMGEIDHVKWTDASDRIAQSCADRLLELSAKDVNLAITLCNHGRIPIGQLLTQHGLSSIFKSARFKIFPNVTSSTPAEIIVSQVIFQRSFYRDNVVEVYRIHALGELAKVLPAAPLPWARNLPHQAGEWMLDFAGQRNQSTMLGSNELFAAFLLLACLWEAILHTANPNLARLERPQPLPLFNKLWPILRVRALGGDSSIIEQEAKQCGFDAQQTALATDWALHKTNFTDSAANLADDSDTEPDEDLVIS
jgi:hypothetical protein